MNIYLFGRQNESASEIRYYILNLFSVNVKINKVIDLINNYIPTNKNNIINILFSFYQLNNTDTYNYNIKKELNSIFDNVLDFFKNQNLIVVDTINLKLLEINTKTVKIVDLHFKSKYLKYKEKYLKYKREIIKI
jgi:hypothetical protein